MAGMVHKDQYCGGLDLGVTDGKKQDRRGLCLGSGPWMGKKRTSAEKGER